MKWLGKLYDIILFHFHNLCHSMPIFPILISLPFHFPLVVMFFDISLGVLTVLIFDPFFFIFVDIDHQKWSEKWTEKWELWTCPPWNFEKWVKKWVKNGTVHFSAPQQPWTLHLVAGPALSYHFPNAFCQPQIFLESLLIGLQSIKSFLS